MTVTMIDTTQNVTPFLPALTTKGIKHISRYITRTFDQYKVIKRPEALAITAAGIRIIANYEGAGATPSAFTFASGLTDGRYARIYGANELSMPPEAAVYFSTEARFDSGYINSNLIPYFKGVAQAMTEQSDHPSYGVGVYSAGSVIEALVAADLVQHHWLANAMGWPDSRKFLASGKWQIHQLPTINNFVRGLNVDPGEINPNYTGSLGDFGSDGQIATKQPEPVTSPFSTIRRGSTGPDVVTAQTMLGIDADGDFGTETEDAVVKFQKEYDLTPTGVIGPLTWAQLQAVAQGV